MQADICSALHEYDAYFLEICIYFIHVNDCRLIKGKLNTCSLFQYKDVSAINRLLSDFQPSWIL